MAMMMIPRRHCRLSIFGSEPHFRLLRCITVMEVHPFRHARLSRLLHAQWCIARDHSSWSRV